MLGSKVICLIIVFIYTCFKSTSANSYNSSNLYYLTTTQLLDLWGYPSETHQVQTEDGYILTVHRIVNKSSRPYPLILEHGLWSASDTWVLRGQDDLAIQLSNRGYDVWLANSRGSTYGKRHKFLKINQLKFWKFSFHEIGTYDIPATVDYVLKVTGHRQVIHIGHSMGTTSFYVMATTRPGYNDKIRAHFSLAPIAYMSNLRCFETALRPVLNTNYWREDIFDELQAKLKLYDMFTIGQSAKEAMRAFVDIESNYKSYLREVFAVVGPDYIYITKEMLLRYIGHFLAGGSTRTLFHYQQHVLTGKFNRYRYLDKITNLNKYGTLVPPDYNLTLISTPVYLYYSTNDYLSEYKNVIRLANQLTNLRKLYKVPYNHFGYLIGSKSKTLLYDDIIKEINKFEKSSILTR